MYVIEKVKTLLKAQEKRANKSADEIIEKLEKIAFKKGKLPNKGRLSDQIKSLELLGKRFGIFPNKTEISGVDGEPLAPITVVVKNEKVQK